MIDAIEYLLWSPDRETFIAVMAALQNPVTKTPLAAVIEGVLVPSEFVRIDEIGEIVKDDVTVEGHHVNMVAYGALAAMLNANGGWSAIFSLLGKMDAVQPGDGVPAGWEGTSGVKIYAPDAVKQRVRIWA